MSLARAPFGLKPIKTLNGGDLRVGRYTVSSASSRIFNGDIVTLNSLGLVTRRAATSTDLKCLGVAGKDTGVIAGQITDFPVYDDPSTVFIAQCNNSGAITQAKFGFPYTFSAAAGVTATGRSVEIIAIGSSAASASNIVRPIRLHPILGNDLSQYSVVECTLQGDPTKAGRE